MRYQDSNPDRDFGARSCSFITELSVERFAEAILPRTPGLDVERIGANRQYPVPDDFGCHLGTVVRTDVRRNAAGQHEIGQRLDVIHAVAPSTDPDSQCLPGELVDESKQSQASPIVGRVVNEVVGPDVVGAFGAQPYTGRA